MDTSPLPKALQVRAGRIFQQVCQLQATWKVYRQVYLTSAERLGLLNQTAPRFFLICQAALEDELFLGACRLTDAASSGRNENLSLANLVSQLGPADLKDLHGILDAKVRALDSVCKNLRIHRNKRIAHLDLRTSLHIKPLPPVLYHDLQEAIEGIISLFYTLLRHFNPSTDYASDDIALNGDGEALVCALQDAVTFRADSHERDLRGA